VKREFKTQTEETKASETIGDAEEIDVKWNNSHKIQNTQDLACPSDAAP